MARELFIYWRVAQADAAQAEAAAQTMQRQLCQAHPGLQAKLYRRPDVRDGECTLMETYSRPPAGVDAALRATIESRATWGAAPRHVELFDTLED